MIRQLWIGILVTLGGTLTVSAIGKNDEASRIKRRIAVFAFDDKTAGGWFDHKGTGLAMTELLTLALSETQRYLIIPSGQNGETGASKNGTNGFLPEHVTKIGADLGVELAVRGVVTELGYGKRRASGRMRGSGSGQEEDVALVAFDWQLIDITSGEVFDKESVRKEKSANNIKVDTRPKPFAGVSDFEESLLGKVCRDAVKQIVQRVDEIVPLIPWQAVLVGESEAGVQINAGELAGLRVGDQLVVYRTGEELVDEETGLSLGRIDSQIGVIAISDPKVDAGKASECRIVAGSGFVPGDIVRLK